LLNSNSKAFWFSKLFNGQNENEITNVKELRTEVCFMNKYNYNDMIVALKKISANVGLLIESSIIIKQTENAVKSAIANDEK